MCPVLAGICGATFLEGVLVFTFLVHSIHCVLYTSGEADLSIYTSLMVIYIYIYIYIHAYTWYYRYQQSVPTISPCDSFASPQAWASVGLILFLFCRPLQRCCLHWRIADGLNDE